MINYHERFRQLLLNTLKDKNIEVYYEAFDEKTDVPCVSYLEVSNITSLKGDTLEFSSLSFQVSIWTKTVEELIEISTLISAGLESAGFRRASTQETLDERLFRKILRFDATGYEKF